MIKESESSINPSSMKFLKQLESLMSEKEEERKKTTRSVPSDLDSNQSTKKGSENTILNGEESIDEEAFKIKALHEKKFSISSFFLQSLMVEMSDPKKNHLAQSICFPSDSFELILPYLIHLFEDPNTCVDALLNLLKKVHRFLSRSEMVKKFLPIILHLMNVVDLGETIELSSYEKKAKFCKLFDFAFINELRIIFGLKIFLTQICPFLVEAISGFKDFDYDVDSFSSTSVDETKDNSALNETKNINPSADIFYMEGEQRLNFFKQLFLILNKLVTIKKTFIFFFL